MPKNVMEYRCLLISPSDVEEERAALTSLVTRWNAQIGLALGARVELVRWESHATPEMGADPQSVINAQLVEDVDFGIGIFWSRVGTPTTEHDSGSIEEIRTLMARGARVLLYFCSKPIPQEALNTDQFAKLQQIKKQFQGEGLLGSYSDTSNLVEQVQLHLTTVIAEFLTKDIATVGVLHQPETAKLQRPDIQVKTQIGLVPMGFKNGIAEVLAIEVQNRSPLVVFLGNVQLRLKDKRTLLVPVDSVTGEHQKRRELRPGEKFSFYISPERIKSQVEPELLLNAYVSDDIDRVYSSDEDEFRKTIDLLFREETGER